MGGGKDPRIGVTRAWKIKNIILEFYFPFSDRDRIFSWVSSEATLFKLVDFYYPNWLDNPIVFDIFFF